MITGVQDLRYVLRGLRRSPGFTAVAIVTLAFAIGVNTAIYTVASGLLLRPLPVPHADRLVLLTIQLSDRLADSFSAPRYFFFQQHLRPELEQLSAYEKLGTGFTLVGDGLPERIMGSHVTAGFFSTLGVVPGLGRDFVTEDDRPGVQPTVILSHALWARRFGADPRIIDHSINLNGQPYTVIGVMPPGFGFPGKTQLWTPFAFEPNATDDASYFQLLGLRRPNVSVAAVAAKAKALTTTYAAAFPKSDVGGQVMFGALSLQERLYGRTREPLLVLTAAVGSILLIACVNLSNLQLARSGGRRRDLSLRVALGASRVRILGQAMTESLALGVLGCIPGILLGATLVGPLTRMSPAGLDPLAGVHLDLRVLLFGVGLSLAASVLFGSVPALQAVRSSGLHLRDSSSRVTDGRPAHWLRRSLVVCEIAMALALVAAAGLLVRSYQDLMASAPGFEVGHVLTLKLPLPEKYANATAIEQFSTGLTTRLLSLPGVTAATLASHMPLERGPSMPLRPIERSTGGEDGRGHYGAFYHAASPDFLRVMRIPLKSGRPFRPSDNAAAPLVALVNETAAQRLWPHEDPVGRQVLIDDDPTEEHSSHPRTIIGVVRDSHDRDLDIAPVKTVYVPLTQMPDSSKKLMFHVMPLTVAVRSTGSETDLTAAAKRVIWALDPAQPIEDVKTMRTIRDESIATRRSTTLLLVCLGFAALALAAIGVYGVLSYLVQERTREMGVRRALGASTAQVLTLVLGEGLGTAAAGIAIGLAASIGLGRLLQGFMFGVTTHDPLTLVATASILAFVALLASVLPAIRASHVDPLIALRHD